MRAQHHQHSRACSTAARALGRRPGPGPMRDDRQRARGRAWPAARRSGRRGRCRRWRSPASRASPWRSRAQELERRVAAAGSRARNSAITARLPALEQRRRLELDQHEQRPQHEQRDDERAEPAARGGIRIGARCGATAIGACTRRSLARGAQGSTRAAPVACVGRHARLGRVELVQHRLGDRSGGRSNTTSPSLQADRCAGTSAARGRPRAALATRVAPVASLATSWPSVTSARVGSIAETGSSARIRSGCWYSTRATPTRCSCPPDRRSQRSNSRSASSSRASALRRRRCRAGRSASRSPSSVGQLPSRPARMAVTTRRRGGNRRLLVHDADAASQAPQRARRQPPRRSPSTSTLPSSDAAPRRARATARSCPRPTDRSPQRVRPPGGAARRRAARVVRSDRRDRRCRARSPSARGSRVT